MVIWAQPDRWDPPDRRARQAPKAIRAYWDLPARKARRVTQASLGRSGRQAPRAMPGPLGPMELPDRKAPGAIRAPSARSVLLVPTDHLAPRVIRGRRGPQAFTETPG